MKKALFTVLALTAAVHIFGFSAVVSPSKIGVNTQHNVFVISVSGCEAGNALFSFTIPTEFNTAPDLGGTMSGAVSAAVMRSGVTVQQIPNSNMTVNGNTVVINNVSLTAADTLMFTYGKTDIASGLYGVMAPHYETKVYFGVSYSQDNGLTYAVPDEMPGVNVVFMDLEKSVSSSNIMAGMTVTYTIEYSNMSPYHGANNLRITDSLPQGIAYVSQVSSPALTASVSGNLITFETGSVMSQQSGVISIIARGLPGIINYGSEAINRVYLSGNDMYSNTLSAYAEVSSQVSGIKFEASLTAFPNQTAAGTGSITVVMNVKNTGNVSGTNLRPGILSVSPAGSVDFGVGPQPAYYTYFGVGEVKEFTWVCSAVQAGSLHFSGSVRAAESYSTVEKGDIVSNIITVFTPAATATATSTAEPAPAATATATVTAKPTPAVTPGLITQARTNKNYFNPGKNERVIVYFPAKNPGKISVKVANLNGEKIRAYEVNADTTGVYSIEWDGKNEAGKTAAQGIYFVVIRQDSGAEMVRVAVIK